MERGFELCEKEHEIILNIYIKDDMICIYSIRGVTNMLTLQETKNMKARIELLEGLAEAEGDVK